MFFKAPALALATASFLLVTSPTFAAPPPGGVLDFTVLRNGSEVGRHEMLFRNEADGLKIDIRTNVAVKVAFITAYRFEHEGHEVWQGGHLARLWSKTNDDGIKHVLDVTAGGDNLVVMADGIGVTYAAPRATRTAAADGFHDLVAPFAMTLDDPAVVAARIVDGIAAEADTIYPRGPERLFVWLQRLLPSVIDRALAEKGRKVRHLLEARRPA